MKEVRFTLEWSVPVVEGVWEMGLSGDTSEITAPGQFVDILLPGKFLRRPVSVCNWTENRLLLLVKEAGEGTKELVRLPQEMELDILTGLGSGFDYAPEIVGPNPALAGGGIGIAPLYGLAKRMKAAGQNPTVILGFRSKEDAVYVDEFAALGVPVVIATEDGSLGTKGFVTDGLNAMPECGYVLACGPTPMLKAVHSLPQLTGGQFSFEARMACGFGACVGCTIQTANGPKRVCKDGPVFRKEEIVW